MGKAQRRKQARGFGKISTRKNSSDQKFFQVNDSEFLEACEKSPELAALWFCMVDFIQRANNVTKTEAIEFWQEYWGMAILVLGQANIGDPQYHSEHGFWLGRIKGVTLFALQNLRDCSSKAFMSEFYSKVYGNEVTKQFVSMGEVTIEVGLAFQDGCIIYAGKSLIVYKGKDDYSEKGELMIAVKHKSGCWSHYPSPDNVSIPLSDYKKAKLELKKFPTSLKGELTHFGAGKLAKLLGLTVKDNYAYLIK
jgi:hypothetical protein